LRHQPETRAGQLFQSRTAPGETGTGKEVLARYIVEESHRRDKPFMAINCASLPPSLLESEMFGYKSGSFTGAGKRGRRDFFEIAHNGTIFLDDRYFPRHPVPKNEKARPGLKQVACRPCECALSRLPWH
jgi:transcriptional regulator of acetoin/glycerol metabolism